jgi:hypothetical protein
MRILIVCVVRFPDSHLGAGDAVNPGSALGVVCQDGSQQHAEVGLHDDGTDHRGSGGGGVGDDRWF